MRRDELLPLLYSRPSAMVVLLCACRAMLYTHVVCVRCSSGADDEGKREKPSTTTGSAAAAAIVQRCHFSILIRDGRSYLPYETRLPSSLTAILYTRRCKTPSTTFLLGYSPTTIINLEREQPLTCVYVYTSVIKTRI